MSLQASTQDMTSNGATYKSASLNNQQSLSLNSTFVPVLISLSLKKINSKIITSCVRKFCIDRTKSLFDNIREFLDQTVERVHYNFEFNGVLSFLGSKYVEDQKDKCGALDLIDKTFDNVLSVQIYRETNLL